ncbi:MAG: hypothetical protein CMD92_07460 [Gammaproteobacteria bacterium]|nr:hypothetical protein [Gammaproteobacteria bacterium]HBW83731.1 hypothetical protein [Gammaproteobacteria bacterium]|tara:strand:- start:211 stop:537 length:327 start_codon:yes stop_codon:yes gene_type:complete
MAAEFNYYGVWLVYLLASLMFLSAYWRLTSFSRWSALKHFLRCLMIALIFTPWFANSDGDTLAPALMVITLDAITMGFGEVSRALTPLLLSLFVAVLFALILSVRDKR